MDQTPLQPPSPGESHPIVALQTKQKKKHPTGIIILLIYIGVLIFTQLSSLLLIKPIAMFGLVKVTGIPATLYNLVLLGAHIAFFVGLIKQKLWGRLLGMYLYSYFFVVGVLHFLSVVLRPEELKKMYDLFAPGYEEVLSPTLWMLLSIIGTLVSLSVSVAIIFYLFFKKRYFRS